MSHKQIIEDLRLVVINMDEVNAKRQIQDLINNFKANYQQYKHEQEANTETKLIEPLFNILGWTKADFEKRARTRREGKKGFADYAFKIEGRTVFFLEAKRIGIPLDKEADKQVISYALSKRIPFAVSTNFEEMNIFCVEHGIQQCPHCGSWLKWQQ